MLRFLYFLIFTAMSASGNAQSSKLALIVHTKGDSIAFSATNVDSITFCNQENIREYKITNDTIRQQVLVGDTINVPTSNLIGKHFYTVFDSFGASYEWQNKLADLSGMIFDKELNKQTNYGGTTTGGYENMNGLQRARNLVEISKNNSVDYVFLENVNDLNYFNEFGTIDDDSWFFSNKKTILKEGLKSWNESSDYWKEHFDSIVSTISPNFGTIAMLNYETTGTGSQIEILSSTSIDGDYYIIVNNTKYGIHITHDMTIEDIIGKIMEYNYGAGIEFRQKSNNSIVFNTDIAVDAGTTEIKSIVSSTNSMSTIAYYFIGKSLEDWKKPSAWIYHIPSVCAFWKGELEYLTKNLPQASIYMVIPTYYKYDFSNIPTDNNGEPNYEDINSGVRQTWLKLSDLLRQLSTLYNIPIIDLEKESGINIYNASYFYDNNNCHPRTAGYNRWAETIYRKLR